MEKRQTIFYPKIFFRKLNKLVSILEYLLNKHFNRRKIRKNNNRIPKNVEINFQFSEQKFSFAFYNFLQTIFRVFLYTNHEKVFRNGNEPRFLRNTVFGRCKQQARNE